MVFFKKRITIDQLKFIFQLCNLIPNSGGFFKFHIFCGMVHGFAKVVDQLVFAFEGHFLMAGLALY